MKKYTDFDSEGRVPYEEEQKSVYDRVSVLLVEAAGIETQETENTRLTTCGQNLEKSGLSCPNCGQHLELRNGTDANQRSNPDTRKPTPDELSPPNGPNEKDGLPRVIQSWPKLSKQAKQAITFIIRNGSIES